MSLGLKKPKDFTVSKGHRYPLVKTILLTKDFGFMKCILIIVKFLKKIIEASLQKFEKKIRSMLKEIEV